MRDFYWYVFTKGFYFCIRVFREKDEAWVFGALTFSMAIATALITIVEFIEVLMLPKRLYVYQPYFAYASFAMAILSLFYFRRDRKYIRVVEHVNALPEPKKKRFFRIMVIYFTVIVVGMLTCGYILHEFNIRNY
jgi:hypothetical protein